MTLDLPGPDLIPKGGQVHPVGQKTGPGNGQALFRERPGHVKKQAVGLFGNGLQLFIDFCNFPGQSGQGEEKPLRR